MNKEQKLKYIFNQTALIIKTDYGFSSFYRITKSHIIPDHLWNIYYCGYIDGYHFNHESFLYMDYLSNNLDHMNIDELFQAVAVVDNILIKLRLCFSKLEGK